MKTVELILPNLHPKQREFIKDETRFGICVAGTKAGKTLGCSIWLVENAWNNPDTLWWWVAPVYKQTLIGWRRCRDLIPREEVIAKESLLRLELNNGSIIEGRSADNPDNLYGEAVNGGVLDECDRMKRLAWSAFRSTITQTRGNAKLISNPVRRDWFYEMYQRGLTESDEFKSFKLLTSDNPYVALEEIEQAKKQLPESMFKSLYLAEFPEEEGMVFKGLMKCISGELADPILGRMYIVGADLARTHDFTVLTVIDAVSRKVVAFERFKEVSWKIQKERIMNLVRRYNNALLILDSSNAGDAIKEDLENFGINVQGYDFKSKEQTKRQLIENLMVAIEQRWITFPNVEILVNELKVYGYSVTPHGNIQYNAPEGLYDDAVISLALVVYGLKKENYLQPIMPQRFEKSTLHLTPAGMTGYGV